MVWYSILLVIAVLLSLGLPPNPETLADLHISATGYRLAVAAILVPYAVLWYAGFYVFAKVSEYTRFLGTTREGKAFRSTSIGLGILAFGLIVPTILDTIVGFAAQKFHSLNTLAAVDHNYYTVIFTIVAFTYISNGSVKLVERIKSHPPLIAMRLFGIVFVLLGSIYGYLVTHNFHTNGNPYHIAVPFILLTIIAPHLYVWFMGFLSAMEFSVYATDVQGVIYRRTLRLFATGIVVTIAGAITNQFIASTVSSHQTSVWFVLLFDFVPLAVLVAGLGIMAAGARQLKRIEEV
jgi:hypothetical protein